MNDRNFLAENPTKTKVDGIEINYLKVGNGPQRLLLLPGTLGCVDSFKTLIENLDRKKYTIVAWDPPGYGLSRPPNREFSPGYLYRDADYAISLMETLHIDKYSLLGWCNGGSTALVLASKAASRIEKLVVWSCNAYLTEKELKFIENRRDISKWPEIIKQTNIEIYGEKYFSTTWNSWVDWSRTILEDNRGDICLEALPKIKASTLILHGALDPLVPVEHAVYLHKHIENSSLEIFPDGKHTLHIMFPERFISVVDKFLSIVE